MRFNLYECEIERSGSTVRGYVVAASEDQAAEVVIDHDIALGLTHQSFTLERVDETLEELHRRGLDDLLMSAPVGFASYCDFGWIPHTAPIHKLRFFQSTDAKGGDVFAVAPNFTVASALIANTMLPDADPHVFVLREGLENLPPHMIENVDNLLELGPVGIAEFDDDERRWFVW